VTVEPAVLVATAPGDAFTAIEVNEQNPRQFLHFQGEKVSGVGDQRR
jgi:hypothetical protein